jgi:hypothetical protein
MTRLEIHQLIKARACESRLPLFTSLFPDGVDVTEELCVLHYDKFYWDWAADNLLTAPAQAEYQKAKVSAQAEYQKAKAPAWAEYQKARVSAWAEYQKVTAPAWAEYLKAKASAWARAYNNQSV